MKLGLSRWGLQFQFSVPSEVLGALGQVISLCTPGQLWDTQRDMGVRRLSKQ